MSTTSSWRSSSTAPTSPAKGCSRAGGAPPGALPVLPVPDAARSRGAARASTSSPRRRGPSACSPWSAATPADGDRAPSGAGRRSMQVESAATMRVGGWSCEHAEPAASVPARPRRRACLVHRALGRVSALAEAVDPPGWCGSSTGCRGGARPAGGLLVGAAVAGSALVTDPRAYALRPQSAYATICGPANTASSGWSIFCATVNKGVNACPPGSFTAGWWKAADSSWCGGGYRYIVDCNAKCTKCTIGCSDHICDSKCWNCSCRSGSTATCDQRQHLLQRLPVRPVQHPGQVQRRRALPGRVVRAPVQVDQLLDHVVPQRRHRRAQLCLPAAVGADGAALHRDGRPPVLPQGLEPARSAHHRRHRDVRQLPGRPDLVDERAPGRPR